jgi:hypothetical protein
LAISDLQERQLKKVAGFPNTVRTRSKAKHFTISRNN